LVRSAIVWAGEPDPGEVREGLSDAADSQRDALGQLLRGWLMLDPGQKGLTVAEVLARLEQAPEPGTQDEDELWRRLISAGICELCGVAKVNTSVAKSLGKQLARVRKRNVDGRYFESTTRDRSGAWKWRVMRVANKES